MQYQVQYLRPKKKGHYSKQTATFLTIDDAIWYENLMKQQGHKEVQINVC